LFIGEYGIYPDNQGIEGPLYTNWQSTLASMVAYLKSQPLWGYQWWVYQALYGKVTNNEWASQGYTTYSQSDSTYILNTVLHP
jgi:hypothetical protein